MILTIEARESTVSVCRVEEGKKTGRFTLEAGGDLAAAAEAAGVDLKRAEGAVLASDAPETAEGIAAALGYAPLTVGPDTDIGAAFPAETDPLLIAAAAGALGRYRLPCVLIRTGETVAVGALDAQGNYAGSLVCPGIPAGAAIADPLQFLGATARESAENGLVYGMAAMLDGLITRAETELRQQAAVVLFGRGTKEILPHCHRNQNALVDDDVVMRGLWRVWCERGGKA